MDTRFGRGFREDPVNKIHEPNGAVGYFVLGNQAEAWLCLNYPRKLPSDTACLQGIVVSGWHAESGMQHWCLVGMQDHV